MEYAIKELFSALKRVEDSYSFYMSTKNPNPECFPVKQNREMYKDYSIALGHLIAIKGEINSFVKPIQLEDGEWLYGGCFIQKNDHPSLIYKYVVFKNNEEQTHIGGAFSKKEAMKLCEDNPCFENHLDFE